MSTIEEELSCPFCDFKETIPYKLMYHVETAHNETGESPFAVKDEPLHDQQQGRASPEPQQEVTTSETKTVPPSQSDNQQYVSCPHGCGERILLAELAVHTDLHLAENMAFEEAGVANEVHLSTGPCNDQQALIELSNAFTTDIPKSLRNYDQLQPTTPPNKSHRRTSLKDLILGSPSSPKTPKASASKIRRLGRSELGPYAHEKQMPNWLRKLLDEGAKVTITNQLSPNGTIIRVEAIANETADVIPVLARLSALDSTVERAYYCDPAIHYVSKLPKEGGFCGYRNIQMLVSYIRSAGAFGFEHFDGPRIPSILKLQDMIENAWDMGFNATGKIETGGIRLTRKYIGTPEAQALFQSLGIPCAASAFSRSAHLRAHENLLLAVANYFRSETQEHSVLHRDGHSNQVVITRKPPIYFQHRGHSMTVVGWESRYDGGVNLVVFDPMFQPNATIKRMAMTGSLSVREPAKVMKAHRRGENYLAKFNDFELLMLKAATPASESKET